MVLKLRRIDIYFFDVEGWMGREVGGSLVLWFLFFLGSS